MPKTIEDKAVSLLNQLFNTDAANTDGIDDQERVRLRFYNAYCRAAFLQDSCSGIKKQKV